MYRLFSAAGVKSRPGSQISSSGLLVTVESATGIADRDSLNQRAAPIVSADFPFRDTAKREYVSPSEKRAFGKVQTSEPETATALRRLSWVKNAAAVRHR